jgi:hypothetical protein
MLEIAINKIATANNSITNLAILLNEKSEQLKKSEEDLDKINKEISEGNKISCRYICNEKVFVYS